MLYRKAWPLVPGSRIEEYHAVAETLALLGQEGDAVLLVPPGQVEGLGRAYDGRLHPYPLPQRQPLDPEATAGALAEIAARHPVLFTVFQEEETVDPERVIENWLNEHAYRSRTEWYGSVRLVVYGAPHAGAEEARRPLEARLGEQIMLLGYGLAEEVVEPGRMVRLSLSWQAEGPVTERLAVFAHLLDGEGRLVAQQDSEPVGGTRPTTTWATGEMIRDTLGILIPPDAAAGEYQLVVGMYRPETGERLPVLDQSGAIAGDSQALNTIQVRKP
jgi:hypothetical protein